MHSFHTLHILPDNRRIQVVHDAVLHEELDRHGISLTAHCDGMGLCGKCVVVIQLPDGSHPPVTGADARFISASRRAAGARLACQWRVCSDATVTIPPLSRINHLHILADADPTAVQPGATVDEQAPYGIAVDIGTTTVVGTLLDRRSGVACAVSSRLNLQYRYGADVISRINHSLQPGGMEELHTAIAETVNAIIANLLAESGFLPETIGEITVTGNTVMLHILHREPMDTLAVLPFEPVFRESRMAAAADIGISLNVPVYSFPVIGGFVGGDTVACMLAVDMDHSENCIMIIDVGTNGEVALGCDGTCITTSAPAGPAFEGRGISCGMHGAPGAIEHVRITREGIQLDVIEQQPPLGICGTGLIDATAALLDWGILDYTGRLVDPDELAADTPEWLKQRIVSSNGQNAFLLFNPAVDSFHRGQTTPELLYLTQKDFREVQLAKGAIATAAAILLVHSGKTLQDVKTIYLAGAFGNYLRPVQARRIGLLPDVPISNISFIGNAASTGAKRVLVSPDCRRRAERIAASAGHVDLAADPGFQMLFADHMLFPETLNHEHC